MIKETFNKIIHFLFLDIKVFIISIICFTILTIGLLVYGSSCVKSSALSPNDILMYPITKPPQTFPLKFHVTDEFSNNKIALFQKAASDWNIFSNGIVTMEFEFNWEPPVYFSADYYETYGKNTIWMKTGNEEEVVKLFLKYSIVGDGFTIGNFIVIINPFDKLDDKTLQIIIAHEMFHVLGGEHIKKEYPALLNPGGNGGVFTNNDKLVFCSIYKCAE